MKIKLAVIINIIVLGFTSLTAQEIQTDVTLVDYGVIKKDSDGKRIFTLKNTGTKELIIENAVGNCGCTVPEYPKKPIAAGETFEIKVNYDTKRVGTFAKQVKLYTNALNKNPLVLKIKGEVKE